MSARVDLALIFPGYKAWAHTVADSILPPSHPDHDDVAQEGVIAMWSAVQRADAAREPAAYARTVARYRMVDIAQGRPPTGTPERPRAEHGTVGGRQTRDRIRAHLREHPRATGRELAVALAVSQATISFHRKRLLMDSPLDPDVSSLDALLDAGFDPTVAADLLDGVTLAYHRGEISEALDGLTANQRRYVWLRFWEGLSAAEINAEYGYSAGAVWTSARRRLAESLAHLAAA